MFCRVNPIYQIIKILSWISPLLFGIKNWLKTGFPLAKFNLVIHDMNKQQ